MQFLFETFLLSARDASLIYQEILRTTVTQWLPLMRKKKIFQTSSYLPENNDNLPLMVTKICFVFSLSMKT